MVSSLGFSTVLAVNFADLAMFFGRARYFFPRRTLALGLARLPEIRSTLGAHVRFGSSLSHLRTLQRRWSPLSGLFPRLPVFAPG